MLKPKQLVLLFLSLFFLNLGLLSSVYFDNPSSEKEIARGVSKSLQRELARVEKEAAALLNQPNGNPAWQSVTDSFFLMDSLTVLEWTTNVFLPDARALQGNFKTKLIRVTQGDFLVKKWPIRDAAFLLFVLPLRKDYNIVNNYLSPEWNASVFEAPLRIVDPAGEGEPVLFEEAQCIFKIRKLEGQAGEGPLNTLGLLSVTLSIAGFLIFAYGVLGRWHQEKKYEVTFLGMAVSLIALRIAMVKFNFPNAFSDFLLFDPHRFASSSFNASMGDLLLNSLIVLLLCLYLFMTYPHWKLVKKLITSPPFYRLLICTVCLFICFLSLLYPYLFVEIIYHNSSVSLEITDAVSFDDIRWIALISLLLGGTSSFLFIHVFFRITLVLTRQNRIHFWIAVFASGLMFLVFFLITQKSYWITLEVGLVYFAVLLLGKVVQQFKGFTFKTFLYFLVVTIILAFQGALSLKKFNEERRVRDQFRFSNKFLVDQDVLGEFLLNESARRIANDPFIQSVFLSPFLSKNSIRQKIRQFYLNTYFNRYDIQIFLYNASGSPFHPQASADFADMIRNYQGERYKTAYPGIYFINTPTAEATKQYLVIIPVKRHQLAAGFVVLNLKLKKVIPRNVYPELLVDNRFSHYFKSKEFSYAVYSRGRLTNSFGEFNYEKDFNKNLLTQSPLFQRGVADNGFYHIGIEDQDGQSAVVTARIYTVFFLIPNFSFLFLLGRVVVLLVLLIIGSATWARGGRLDYA